MSAGVLLRRPAHTKTSCVGFGETQGQRVQIPSFHSAFPFSPARKSFSSVAASLLTASADVLLVFCLRRLKLRQAAPLDRSPHPAADGGAAAQPGRSLLA